MFDEIDKRDRTINDWEKDIKKKILNEANRSVGTQKFKIGKTKLKGWWWDNEVEKAIEERKKENRIQVGKS